MCESQNATLNGPTRRVECVTPVIKRGTRRPSAKSAPRKIRKNTHPTTGSRLSNQGAMRTATLTAHMSLWACAGPVIRRTDPIGSEQSVIQSVQLWQMANVVCVSRAANTGLILNGLKSNLDGLRQQVEDDSEIKWLLRMEDGVRARTVQRQTRRFSRWSTLTVTGRRIEPASAVMRTRTCGVVDGLKTATPCCAGTATP